MCRWGAGERSRSSPARCCCSPLTLAAISPVPPWWWTAGSWREWPYAVRMTSDIPLVERLSSLPFAAPGDPRGVPAAVLLALSPVEGADDLSLVLVRRPHFMRNHAGDRKSTRLNSSHVRISYAVFCLKKKN